MLSAPDASSGGIQFTAPLQNDFQWRNLYMKQYGTCTYPPPIPKNPSTTSNAFPKRKDIGTYLGDIDSDGEEDYTTVETVHRKSLSRKESFFNLADNFVNDEAGGGAQGDGDSHHRHGDDGKNSNQDDSELESFLFAPNIFNFLYKKKPKAPVPGSNFSDISSDVADPTLPAEGSIGSLAVGSHLINPHHIPREIFKLHRDAWSLLMDNRAMAWLEREASEKGHTATNVRRRLLEVAVGPNSMLAKNWEKINAEDFQAVRSPPISEEASFQRVYESFVPFFAVISSPSIVRRLKDQFMASRRVQTRGMAGAAADIVGYPLFSQFSTWKEAYQHRKLWNCTPLSFFLIHDASFNYAHISAVYVLLGVINDHSHVHSHKCIGNKSGPILLEEASRLLLHSREIRKAVEMQRYLCPLLAVQQVTEDILLAFEQSASRTTLSMVLNVCGFLTDCVLDPETATRFLGREALVRQSSFHVPGMNVMKTEDVAAPAATKPEGEDAEEGEGDATTDQLPNSPDDQGIQAFGLKQFSDADFDALFDLVFWFIDAPTANSRVPVDTALIPPPREHHSPHADQPDQLQPTGSMETTTSPRKRSNSPAFGRGKLKRSNSISMSGTQNQAQNNNNNNNANNNSGATEHQYIPGRLQVFSPVRSIVEAVTLHEVCRGALMQVKQRSSTKDASRAKKASRGGTRNMSMEIPSRDNTRDDLSESVSSIKEPSLSLSTTLLATPLIFISSYIRLHGGPWLKHLFNRLFNILRRESVLLYVNRLDLGEPRHIMDPTPHIPAGSTPTTTPTKRSNSPHLRPSPSTLSPSRGGLESESSHAFIGRMERLEDLICQDIQFLMNEFFSALHGKRSLTRLPQGITSLITQFTSTVHLHLLNSITMATVDNTDRPGNTAKRVRDSIGALKQKRMAGKAFRADHITDSSVSRLICNIEQYRMTKFLLFDTWIIPALNDAVSCGYLSESSSLHLRWNIDAFARYLKILVNSPFADADSSSRANVPKTMIQSPASRRKKSSSSNLRDTMQPPFTLTLPRYITGIYDVSSGSLVRVFSPQGPSTPPPLATPPDEASVPASPVYHHVNEMSLPTLMPQTRTFGSLRAPQWKPTPPSRSPAGLSQSLQLETSVSVFNTVNRSSYFKVMDEAGWEDISASMRGLNEGLGIAGYDPDEEADIYRMDRGIGAYSEENCAMRVLDIFCRRASYEGSTNVVVSEFEVLPSMAAGCIDKIYDMMTGAHPLVSQSLGSGALPNKFSFSPYLACLNGVLLHPKSAARALDNIYYNSQRFYNTLMQPVRDESILNMLSALVVDQDDLPMVDSNALQPLLSSIPPLNEPPTQGSLAQKWEAEARKLQLHQSFLTTGAPSGSTCMQSIMRKVRPDDPLNVVRAGAETIEREASIVPTCFDPWWRAMTLALCVKVMTVFSECSPTHSNSFDQWCQQKVDHTRKEHRLLYDLFIQNKGKKVEQKDVVAAEGSKKRKVTTGTLNAFGSVGPSLTALPKRKKRRAKSKRK